jgi:hypothetical protein
MILMLLGRAADRDVDKGKPVVRQGRKARGLECSR